MSDLGAVGGFPRIRCCPPVRGDGTLLAVLRERVAHPQVHEQREDRHTDDGEPHAVHDVGALGSQINRDVSEKSDDKHQCHEHRKSEEPEEHFENFAVHVDSSLNWFD